jgi:hypothetical protein
MFREERLRSAPSLTTWERRLNGEKLLLVLLNGRSNREGRFSEDLLLTRPGGSGREILR